MSVFRYWREHESYFKHFPCKLHSCVSAVPLRSRSHDTISHVKDALEEMTEESGEAVRGSRGGVLADCWIVLPQGGSVRNGVSLYVFQSPQRTLSFLAQLLVRQEQFLDSMAWAGREQWRPRVDHLALLLLDFLQKDVWFPVAVVGHEAWSWSQMLHLPHIDSHHLCTPCYM